LTAFGGNSGPGKKGLGTMIKNFARGSTLVHKGRKQSWGCSAKSRIGPLLVEEVKWGKKKHWKGEVEPEWGKDLPRP